MNWFPNLNDKTPGEFPHAAAHDNGTMKLGGWDITDLSLHFFFCRI